MGGQRGLNLFPEGHDGRGWSRVSRELSKALALLGATDGSPCSGGPPARNKLGKEAGLPSFTEVVHSAATALSWVAGLWVRILVHGVKQRL